MLYEVITRPRRQIGGRDAARGDLGLGETLIADNVQGCVAQNTDPAPPTFASAPDPRGISTRHVFDRLVEYDRRSGRIVPGLATRWEVADA